MTGAGAEMECGDVKDLGLPEVRGLDGGVMWDLSFKQSDSWKDQGVVHQVLEVGNS